MKLENPIKINIAKKDQYLYATKMGNIQTDTCKLLNVLYVPELSNNLLSVSRIENNGYGIKFENNVVNIQDVEELENEKASTSEQNTT